MHLEEFSLSQLMNIVIADDHPLFRQALLIMLSSEFVDTNIIEVQSIVELDEQLKKMNIDLLLLDLDIPGANGFDSLIKIRKQFPNMAVVIISGFDDNETIAKAMVLGAAGFIPKSSTVPNMVIAIKEVLQGQLWTPDYYNQNQAISDSIVSKLSLLTPQQYKILMMIGDGLLNKQIAYELGLSESTIKSHAGTIFLKLGVHNRTQAVIALKEMQSIPTQFK